MCQPGLLATIQDRYKIAVTAKLALYVAFKLEHQNIMVQ